MSRKDEVLRVWIEQAPGREFWVHSSALVVPRLASNLPEAIRWAHAELDAACPACKVQP